MAQPPKTPAPPRRKSATARQTTRGRPRKTPVPAAGDTAGTTTAPATKPATPRAKTTRAKTAASDTAKTVRRKATAATKAAADSAPAQFVTDARDKLGDRNFFAALVGGVAAIGAAVTGIALALRDGNSDSPARKSKDGPKKS